MTTTPTVPTLHAAVTVQLPLDRAFEFFTASMGRWWPNEYHIGTDMADTILEPEVGGRWYERGTDGSECEWGRVLAWEPPSRLVLTWQISGQWQFDPDPDRASEIEVRFTADGPAQTTVNLEHRHLDRLVEGQAMYEAVAEPDTGWSAVLARFGAVSSAASR